MVNRPLLTDMGNRIRKKRKSLGYTQANLAELADISEQMVSDVELGKKSIKPENLIKICSALNVTADYILTGYEPAEIMFKDVDKLSRKQAQRIKAIVENCIGLCEDE